MLYSIVSPLLLCVSSCYNQWAEKGGKCVLEIVRNFICRNGNPDGIGICFMAYEIS